MPNINDFEHASINNGWTVEDKQASNPANVARAAEVKGRHVVMKVDASYSSSTISGELTVLFGATVVGRKNIHGAGALDFGWRGRMNPNLNEAVSASLTSGGAGVDAIITISGFTVYG